MGAATKQLLLLILLACDPQPGSRRRHSALARKIIRYFGLFGHYVAVYILILFIQGVGGFEDISAGKWFAHLLPKVHRGISKAYLY